MARKRTVQRGSGSLARNVVWFSVSVTILICASLLFHHIIQWPDLPLKEVLKVSVFSGPDRTPRDESADRNVHPPRKGSKDEKAGEEPQAAAAAPYEYSFYDILSRPQKGTAKDESSFYSIQLGAFKSRQQALAFRDELKDARKLDCRVVKKGAWNVVLWGHFTTRKAAERSSRQIERRLGRDCLVVDLG
ncbi:MAG TPA: SPOR domain-containing protein [Deltaproteobacteria bacterium]|nr:SPOR domain-containing protein [Deltaproteobacteria bacterium]